MSAEKMSKRTKPLPERFVYKLERWDNFRGDDGNCFFRPMPVYTPVENLPTFSEDGVTPELAMFILETHGVYWPTMNPGRFTDYIQGKAIEGLMRKMWVEDAYSGVFWAEDLVVRGLIDFKEAERIFTRKLNGTYLWMFGQENTNKESTNGYNQDSFFIHTRPY